MFLGYHAPLDLYPEFHRIAKDPTIHTVPEGRLVNVCVGKEWYRFPSSFLLPNKWGWTLVIDLKALHMNIIYCKYVLFTCYPLCVHHSLCPLLFWTAGIYSLSSQSSEASCRSHMPADLMPPGYSQQTWTIRTLRNRHDMWVSGFSRIVEMTRSTAC